MLKLNKILAIIILCIIVLFSCLKIKEISSLNENSIFYKIGQVNNDNSEFFTTIKVLKETNDIVNNCNCITFTNSTNNNDIVTWYDCSNRLQQHTMADYEIYSTCGNNPHTLSDKVLVSISDTCCGILPLYITYFDVHYNKNEKEVSWSCENEENIVSYNVYKSTNAKDWQKLITIPKSKGNYKYIDK